MGNQRVGWCKMNRQQIEWVMRENDAAISQVIIEMGAYLKSMVTEVKESGTDQQKENMRKVLSEALQMMVQDE